MWRYGDAAGGKVPYADRLGPCCVEAKYEPDTAGAMDGAIVANMEAGGKPEIGLQAGRLSGGWKVVWSSRIGRGRLGRKVEQGAVFGVLEKGVQL